MGWREQEDEAPVLGRTRPRVESEGGACDSFLSAAVSPQTSAHEDDANATPGGREQVLPPPL